MRTRAIQETDAADWTRMREELWPAPPGEHVREVARFFAGEAREPAEVLLAIGDDGLPIGFAEVSIRNYAEGCHSDRVGYLEGWFVEAGHRRRGVGASLLVAVEAWARAQGCTELASDAELDNTASAAAHRALGFAEVERLICFRKELLPARAATLVSQCS